MEFRPRDSSGWRPMDEAPKDGTRVLCFRTEYAEDVAVVFWNREFEYWQAVHGSEWPDADYWMPLPEPPK